MYERLSRRYFHRVLYVTLLTSLLLSLSKDTSCLMISSQNIQAMAIYRMTSNLVVDQQPSQIVFNVTDSSLINSLVSSIDFTIERDCSKMGALAEAIVYFKFNDGSIEVYALFGKWSHISKVGLSGSCYVVSSTGRMLFQNNAE